MGNLSSFLRLFAVAFVTLVAMTPRLAISEEKKSAPAPTPGTPAAVALSAVPKSLDGLGFGVGIGLTFDVNRDNRIGNATVDANNIVRVTDSSDVIAGFVFESHYFFPALDRVNNTYWMGHGPFIAIEMGSTSGGDGKGIISAYALGWMVGLRRWTSVEYGPKGLVYTYSALSWNIGLGLRVDPNAKTLGDGITVNQPLPPGETTPVRTKTGPRYGLMLISSFSF